MKRALLIGVAGGGLNVKLALDRLAALLERMRFRVTTLSGGRATRAGIAAALTRLVEQAEPGDACLVYYFGHGGRVRFGDLARAPDEHEFGYITCTQDVRGAFEAVLDVELSRQLGALEARCGDVTAMLDCCYSGELARDRDVELAARQVAEAPAWVRAAITPRADQALAIDSHPGVVRLCGSSPSRTAFAVERSGRHIGRMTEAFIATIEAAGDRWERLTWDSIAFHLRERVIAAVGNEGQWVALAGPRTRRLFTRAQVELPGLVGALPGAEPGLASLRAGWLQGVCVGDRWAIAELEVGDAGPEVIVEGRVTEVERSRSTLALDRAVELPIGGPAFVRRVAAPMTVVADPELAPALERSAWLHAVEQDGAARVETRDASMIVSHVDGRPSVTLEPSAAVELLEHWARHAALLRCLAAQRPDAAPVHWSWARLTDAGAHEPLPETGAELFAGDRFVVELRSESLFDPWFISVVLVDADGRMRLLSTRMPEGLELPGRGRTSLGWRVGGARQGIELRWPAGLGDLDSAPASLLLLLSRRPICLAHLVRPQELDLDDALALQGLAGDTLRSHEPELANACAWISAEFRLARAR